MIPPALHHQALLQVEQYCLRASQYYGVRLERPTLTYRLRGKAAGKAYLQQWEIRLNPVLFSENQTAFLQQVIPHEVAHLVVYHQHGRASPHGREWQHIMAVIFGLEPRTTHQFDVRSVQGKTFEYSCQCQHHALTIRRHHKVQHKQAIYRCTQCCQVLHYTGKQLS